CQQHNNYPPSF
nr:immunoglobulin light chain junction region [Macaca mulatta]MOW09900.1 immunoglobulin light chain junction region [Macaca mulatta]MOW10659.1 immunoglobulin light chain junction region [Macaca mulatta]MOW11392.1 immunoglobulin light chain junction region [Macaca mulatta]MOW11653.1 immunoglobulin light chain junction region [Macaca mulatta]